MPYFDVAFGYNNYCQCDHGKGLTITYYIDEDKANKQLVSAERIVEKLLKEAGITFKHAYSYPDGSLYKYIKTDLDEGQLRQTLERIFQGAEVHVNQIYKSCPMENPYKFRKVDEKCVEVKTLMEYFSY